MSKAKTCINCEHYSVDKKGEIVNIENIKPTHRYFMFLGNKKEKKDMLLEFKWDTLPYPKGDNKRYDTSYKPKTQELLFS